MWRPAVTIGSLPGVPQAAKLCPSDPLAANELGVLAYRNRDYEGAARWLRRALEQLPGGRPTAGAEQGWCGGEGNAAPAAPGLVRQAATLPSPGLPSGVLRAAFPSGLHWPALPPNSVHAAAAPRQVRV